MCRNVNTFQSIFIGRSRLIWDISLRSKCRKSRTSGISPRKSYSVPETFPSRSSVKMGNKAVRYIYICIERDQNQSQKSLVERVATVPLFIARGHLYLKRPPRNSAYPFVLLQSCKFLFARDTRRVAFFL